jgi:hypothetical protein
MYSEDEARKLWCPMARVAVDEASANRDIDDTTTFISGCRCIASKCAMWRWGYERMFPGPNGDDVIIQTGYCGLAGKYDFNSIPRGRKTEKVFP